MSVLRQSSSVFRTKDSRDHETEKRRKKIAKTLRLLPFALPKLFEKKSDPSSKLITKYMDREEKLPSFFAALLLREEDKVDWLKFWIQIDEHGTNIVPYSRLIAHFHMEDTPWSQRLFDIANYTFTGYLTFLEFFQFCSTYLIIDKENIQKFTFRILSRRAATYNDGRVVLDLTDIKFFVKDRYVSKSINQKNKRALAIFSNMDKNNLGGVNMTEFMEYADSHLVFTRFANKYLVHLRKCIFGINYWTVKSRKVKRHIAKGLNQLSRASQINKASEYYCGFLGDPVIDAKERPLKDSVAAPGMAGDDEEDAYADEKSLLTFKGPLNKETLPPGVFEEDFPEVVQQHHQESLLRKQRKAEKVNFADLASMRVYKRLVDVCREAMDPKKHIRRAFKHWVQVMKEEKEGIDAQSIPANADGSAPESAVEGAAAAAEVASEYPELEEALVGTVWRFMRPGLEADLPTSTRRLEVWAGASELVSMSIKDKKQLMVDILCDRSKLGRIAEK